MGWKEGEGLGRLSDGMLEPINPLSGTGRGLSASSSSGWYMPTDRLIRWEAANEEDEELQEEAEQQQEEKEAEQEEQAAETTGKRKKGQSANPGAWKRWEKTAMAPEDYKFDADKGPKWAFWSGKLGWEGFHKSAWDTLDRLWHEAHQTGKVQTAILDVGGWKYEINMDLSRVSAVMSSCTEDKAVGWQMALHSNSKRKTTRWIGYLW